MSIKEFNKTTCAQIACDIEEAMKAVCEKHGLEYERKGGRFEDMSFTPKFTLNIRNRMGDDKYSIAFKEHFCLHAEWLGQTMIINDKPFIIKGYDRAKRKWSILIENANKPGDMARTSIEQVQHHFGQV
ncbi:MAG: hypothetical protein KAS32_20770 [Candidatus Peribacteraceae bacterium]|nr:hypothetical protein [Candidatus Peribacteraceae bacterium]